MTGTNGVLMYAEGLDGLWLNMPFICLLSAILIFILVKNINGTSDF